MFWYTKLQWDIFTQNVASHGLFKAIIIWLNANITQEIILFWSVFLSVIILIKVIKKISLEIKIKEFISTHSISEDIASKIKKSMRKAKFVHDIMLAEHEKYLYKDYLEEKLNIKIDERNTNNDPAGILDDINYNRYLKTLRHHNIYKKWYLKGIILWMTSTFWVPFTVMTLYHHPTSILDFIFYGGSGVCFVIWFTKGLLLAPTCFIGAVVHPALLDYMLFHNKYTPQSESVMHKIGYKRNERKNAAAVMSGTFIGKWL